MKLFVCTAFNQIKEKSPTTSVWRQLANRKKKKKNAVN